MIPSSPFFSKLCPPKLFLSTAWSLFATQGVEGKSSSPLYTVSTTTLHPHPPVSRCQEYAISPWLMWEPVVVGKEDKTLHLVALRRPRFNALAERVRGRPVTPSTLEAPWHHHSATRLSISATLKTQSNWSWVTIPNPQREKLWSQMEFLATPGPGSWDKGGESYRDRPPS